MSSCVRRPGLLVVIAMQPLFLVFGIQLASLFKHPAFPIGVVGWFIGGAVNLTLAIKYVVQPGRAWTFYFEWIFPLSGFKASESGIDCCVFGIVAIIATLVSISSWLTVAIPGI